MKKYYVKNLKKMQIIIKWQMTRDLKDKTLKIDQFTIIQYLFKSKNVNNYNSIYILMKESYFMEISKPSDYNKVDLKFYQ